MTYTLMSVFCSDSSAIEPITNQLQDMANQLAAEEPQVGAQQIAEEGQQNGDP